MWRLAIVVAAVVLLLGVAILVRPGGEPGRPTATSPGSSAPVSTARVSPASVAPATGSAVLVGAGDIADCDATGDEATALLLDGIDGTVFTLGDNAYEDGTLAEYRACYDPTWGRHKDRTRPVPGNHEYQTEGAAGYFEYFGGVAGDPDEGWYAYDLGSWRIYALNSNCGAIGGCDTGSAQERWLRADLSANPRPCVAAYWHHPRFSSGEHGNDGDLRDLWQTLHEAGAELVLAGHDHMYERFAPQAADGTADPARGIVSFVVGTGGRRFYEFQTVRPNSLVRDTGTHGVLKLSLAAGSYAFEFVPVAGATFSDTGSGACH